MRPTVRFLEQDLIVKIFEEAKLLLCKLGMEIHNEKVLSLLGDSGAEINLSANHARFNDAMIMKSIKSAPGHFKLYDISGNETHDFSTNNVYFTPGSAALNILDFRENRIRKPDTSDYIEYLKIVSQLNNIAAQSTAIIPSDVHENISDSYRLFLSLLYCEKPVVTGTFRAESFEVMKNLQLAIRGDRDSLKVKPMTVFSCCPTSPLKWSYDTSQNVLDCAEYSIPVEFISMPLSGFMSPVTLVGTIIQHTAETISGIVISQLANPGAPFLYGGSPAIFDVRYETTPMGAIETMMINCANNEIGKYLGFPTQSYIALSDSKLPDAQAGLESGMGALMAALSGINNISGPGMLDFESCQSLEKLIVDNEICGMTNRMLGGIVPKDDFPAIPIFEELQREDHLLISKHTRQYLREEHLFPGPVIDRANRARWVEEGSRTISERAVDEINNYINNYTPPSFAESVKNDLINLMEREAKGVGQEKLPERKL